MAPNASLIMHFSIQYSTIALLWYDYAITWPREVQYFWTKRLTLSTLLYVLCRYGMVANILYTLAIADKLPTLSCDAGYRICAILSVLGRIGITTVWGSRAYAVFRRSKIILVIFGSLELVVIGLALLHVPYVSCTSSNKKEPVVARLAIFMVIYEVASAVLTSVRSVQALNRGGPWKMQQQSLTFLVLREGLIYFGFITTLTILSLICQAGRIPGTFFPQLMNAYTLPLVLVLNPLDKTTLALLPHSSLFFPRTKKCYETQKGGRRSSSS